MRATARATISHPLPVSMPARPVSRRQQRRTPVVPLIRSREADETMILTVSDFMVPAHRRIAASVLQAALVRDVAAFGALILFATMLALVLGGDPGV
ncbi:hypothetical protein [Chthonobacter rhizosphaerae]|uniref:hypothetical protein n=1 Tax=Chthonobacter rhizosphaerae TaxID=2735553 RepID=UPI0015EF8B91|nr:hypothetical protein [Chthonobacter rhizosphaerae]